MGTYPHESGKSKLMNFSAFAYDLRQLSLLLDQSIIFTDASQKHGESLLIRS